jgi:hypothetical protein
MTIYEIELLFERFQQTSQWRKFPNLQKALMFTMLEKARKCSTIADDFARFLQKSMEKKKLFNNLGY